MSSIRCLVGAALAVGMAAPAMAQSDTDHAAPPTAQGASSDVAYTGSAPLKDYHGQFTPDGRPVINISSPTPPSQAYRLLPTDPYVITNGPVPDTKANRQRFGAPLSHAGKLTRPAGD